MKIWLSSFLLIVSSLLASADLRAQDTIVTTFSAVHQGDGNGLATRTVIDTFLFPPDLSGYQQLFMNVILTCPAGGCDPFARFASVQVYHGAEWFEIGRYVTPYGVACSMILDVNDYRSLLTDTVILKSFVDTRTNPGWLVSIVYDFIAGTPANEEIRVENLWLDYNVVYGDSLQPVNLLPVTKTVDSAAAIVKMKILNTGHGQGNTANAAEFSQMTHTLWVNSAQTASQFLWRSDCALNACSPQSGPWQSAHAGWCSGAEVLPFYNDITSSVFPGQPATLEYRLENYVNACNPGNPSCISGVTCADCNYNSSGHTEPHYKISGQLITYIGTPTGVGSVPEKNKIFLHPNPSDGIFSIHANPADPLLHVEVYNVTGNIVHQYEAPANGQILDLSLLPKGVYILKAATRSGSSAEKLIIR